MVTVSRSKAWRARRPALLAALLAACNGELAVEDVTATVSEDVATVITVAWTSSRAEAMRVEYGEAGAFDLATPAESEPTTEHSATLVGMPAETEVSFRIVGDEYEGDAQTATTGALPPGVPDATVDGGGYDGWLLTSVNGGTNWVLMLDDQGRVVWYYDDHRGLSVFRARVARDGQGIVFASAIQGGGPAETSSIVRVPWAGGAEEEHVVPALAHDFVELEDGTVVSLAYHEQDEIEGNSLLAVDRDGGTTELWTTWDCYDPLTDLGDDPSQGWTHANAMDRLDDGTYLVGLRNFGTITHVDPTDRSCAFGFGGQNGTVGLDGGRFIHQHQFEWTGQSMVVFDNDGFTGDESRAVEYTFDGTQDPAPLVREIHADPPEYSFIMGDVHRLPDENTLIAWAVPRKIDLYDPDDARLWRVEVGGNGPLGFVELLENPFTELP